MNFKYVIILYFKIITENKNKKNFYAIKISGNLAYVTEDIKELN